uniref:Rhodanese-like domain-containing protein n=1 Tax=Gracilinema caldarium TaxID=215591 RepID=A0A7C3E9D3_9SPIR
MNNLNKLVFTGIGVLLIGIAFPIFAQNQGKNRAQIAWDLINQKKALIIDVRTEEEFRSGHIQGAVNIPLQIIKKEIQKAYPDKNVPIVLYCRSGNRSQQAYEILKELGYKQIHNGGGYEELLANKPR